MTCLKKSPILRPECTQIMLFFLPNSRYVHIAEMSHVNSWIIKLSISSNAGVKKTVSLTSLPWYSLQSMEWNRHILKQVL